MLRGVLPVLVVCIACNGEATGDDTHSDTNGACGDVSTWDVTVLGAVEDTSGSPVQGATVTLEERNWDPAVYGTASTDGFGQFTIEASDVVSVENCWGTALDYVLVAEDGSRTGSLNANSFLHSAIDDGTLETDLTDLPIEIE